MDQPRIFVSASSQELHSARLMVRDVLGVLGYQPVSQDDFPTGHGNLQEWLKEQIDSCEGLIQIAGEGYGAEPLAVDPAFGRVSYTQFELRYAMRRGKKTWVIFPGAQCKRDRPAEQLDLPEGPNHPDPAGYQAERRALQAEYVAALRRENHLWHNAADDKDLKLLIHRLRDELGVLRQKAQRQWRRLTAAVGSILVLLAILAGSGWWAYARLHRDVQSTSAMTTEKIRAHLLETVEQTHQRELAEAEKEPDWKKRKKLRDAAEAANQSRLAQIDQLAASFHEIEGRGSASTVFQELARILATQGVDAALQYMASQRADILTEVRSRAASAGARNRADLEPLLKTAELYQSKGQADKARDVYRDILSVEPNWPEAESAAYRFLIDLADSELVHATLADAKGDFEEAQGLAMRQAGQDPSNSQWQSELSVCFEKLGDVAAAEGSLDEAARAYAEDLAIASRQAARDPKDTEWQRDLSISYAKLGDIAMRQGRLDDAARQYDEALRVFKKLAATDPSNNESQDNLSITYGKLGEVALGRGNLDDAVRDYGEAITIFKTLTAREPGNSDWQRNLSITYEMLGDIGVRQDQLDEAARDYGEGLTIAAKLAASDPSNSQWQRDLSVSYERSGDIAVKQRRFDDAGQDYGAVLATRKKLAASDRNNSEWQRDLWVANGKLADLAEWRDRPQEAIGYWREALAILDRLKQSGAYVSAEDLESREEIVKKIAAQ